MDKKVVPLYIADGLEVLDKLVEKDDAIKSFKKGHKFSNITKKMLSELLQCQEDQEKCYILSRRYLNLMDHIFQISDDSFYTSSRYISDYNKVDQLFVDLRDSLKQRYKTEIRSETIPRSETIARSESMSRSETMSASESMSTSEITSTSGITYPSGITSTSESTFTSETTFTSGTTFESAMEISDSSSASRSVSTDKGTYIMPNTGREGFKDPPIFKEIFIQPADLFSAMMSSLKLLVVDIRSSEDFKTSRIHVLGGGTLINIPGNSISHGLSANTLGRRLGREVREIWEKRDTFDVIILMDYDTLNHTFAGSKLQRLRSFLVEWDTNRTYKQKPFILNGGLKEFVEWYPSEVDNSQVFLSQTNSDMDELLDLDSVTYPETGTGNRMNLKLHSVNSVGNLESRIKRDFGDSESHTDLYSRSEGNLPVDFYVSKDTSPAQPYKSCSQGALRIEYGSVDPLMEPEFFNADRGIAMAVDEEIKIEEVVAGEKAALLRKAREASKPKITAEGSDNGELDDGENQLLSKKESQSGGIIKPPSVNRSFKPCLPPERVVYGDGYTGLRNVKNICYMNCMLQCLKVIPVIKATYVTSNRYMFYQTRIPPRINPQMGNVLREMWGGTFYNHKFFFIENFKDKIVEVAPMYDRNTHEDTFEFFMFVFNLISEDCAFDLPRPTVMTESEKAWYGHLQGRTSFLVDTFYYQLQNTKICWHCRRPSLSFETDSTLMLPVYQSTCHLQKLIDDYMKDNLVTDYSCSDCKYTATIVNMKEIVVDPEVLVIVLKRYIANMDGTFRKNKAPIEFPLEGLKFGSSDYACYAIAQHSGNMGHGHYFATVLLDDKNKHWVSFNDEQVEKYSDLVNESLGVQISAAGFFYVRQCTN